MPIAVERCIVTRDLTEPRLSPDGRCIVYAMAVGRVRCSDDRHARWITRSSTHRLPATTTGPRFRRRMLVLERRWHSGDLCRGRWKPLGTAGTGRQRAAVDAARCHENGGRPCDERRRKPCRVCPRRGRGVGDATRRWFERATRRRHRRFRLRPLPDAEQQWRRVAGVERAGHAVGSGASPTDPIRSNGRRRVPS